MTDWSDKPKRSTRTQIGAEVVAACFVIDLPEIGGAQRLRDLGVTVRTLMEFEGH